MIIYGHRGARGEAPENTIAGVRHAIARGVRHIEIDLRLSSDGELVVVHDSTLKRTAGVAGRVAGTSASELGKLDARGDGPPWPNSRETGIPSLSTLVLAAPEIEHWQLELKDLGSGANRRLAAATVHWLETHAVAAVVTSSKPDLIRAVKEALPQQAIGLVSSRAKPKPNPQDIGCSYLVQNWQALTSRRQVRGFQQAGIHVSAWTVNDVSVIEHLHKLGVDSIITDYPSMGLPLAAALDREPSKWAPGEKTSTDA